MDLTELLKIATEKGASDLHITEGMPPIIRINGELYPLATSRCRTHAHPLAAMLPPADGAISTPCRTHYLPAIIIYAPMDTNVIVGRNGLLDGKAFRFDVSTSITHT